LRGRTTNHYGAQKLLWETKWEKGFETFRNPKIPNFKGALNLLDRDYPQLSGKSHEYNISDQSNRDKKIVKEKYDVNIAGDKTI